MLPPLVITVAGLGGFVSVLTYAGGFAGAVMSVVPVLLLRRARANGDQTPVWKTRGVDNIVIQALIYSIISLLGLVPAGWA